MPRYYFNIYHRTKYIDRIGEELPDKNAAWREAKITAGRLLQDMDGELLLNNEPLRLEVTDEFALPLFELRVIGKSST